MGFSRDLLLHAFPKTGRGRFPYQIDMAKIQQRCRGSKKEVAMSFTNKNPVEALADSFVHASKHEYMPVEANVQGVTATIKTLIIRDVFRNDEERNAFNDQRKLVGEARMLVRSMLRGNFVTNVFVDGEDPAAISAMMAQLQAKGELFDNIILKGHGYEELNCFQRPAHDFLGSIAQDGCVVCFQSCFAGAHFWNMAAEDDILQLHILGSQWSPVGGKSPELESDLGYGSYTEIKRDYDLGSNRRVYYMLGLKGSSCYNCWAPLYDTLYTTDRMTLHSAGTQVLVPRMMHFENMGEVVTAQVMGGPKI